MEPDSIVATTTAMRRQIAEQLSIVGVDALATPSLCPGWDVFTVGAHLAVSATIPIAALMAAAIRRGGSLRRANDHLAHDMAGRPPGQVLDLLCENANRQLATPRYGPVAPLTEVIVHAGDIFRPLGIPYEPPTDCVREAIDFVLTVRPAGLVRRGRLANLRLVADDLAYAHGSGEVVRGAAVDLLMAACGRQDALDRLQGPGSEVLHARLS
jgi:uncharacterized protein (TIGR03083 family)